MNSEKTYEDVVRDTLDNLEQVVSYCKRVKCEECVFEAENGECLLRYVRSDTLAVFPHEWNTVQIENELLNVGSSVDDEIANASLAELSALREKIDQREKQIREENKDELLDAVSILKQTCNQYSSCEFCPLHDCLCTNSNISFMQVDTIEKRFSKD